MTVAHTLQWIAVFVALLSAAAWLKAATIKVSRRELLELGTHEADKRGEKLNVAVASVNGWSLSATFAAQSRWNSRGALLAGLAVLAQAVAPLLT